MMRTWKNKWVLFIMHHAGYQVKLTSGSSVTDPSLTTIPLFCELVKRLVLISDLMSVGKHPTLCPLSLLKQG